MEGYVQGFCDKTDYLMFLVSLFCRPSCLMLVYIFRVMLGV